MGRKKRKKGNRSHTGCASPLNYICARTAGEQALHPPCCQPHLSAGAGDGRELEEDGFTSESGEKAPSPAGPLHSPTSSGRSTPFITPSPPSDTILRYNAEFDTCVLCFLFILKPPVRSGRVPSFNLHVLTPPTCLMGNETPWRICPPTLSQQLISHG